jgi:hypothetical protein
MASKKKNFDNVDLRKVPRDKRPKPCTGQSAASRELPWDSMSSDEQSIIKMLHSPGHGERKLRSIEYLADGLEGDNPRLQTRNALRRPVSCGWVDHAERATYQISVNGRRRMAAR